MIVLGVDEANPTEDRPVLSTKPALGADLERALGTPPPDEDLAEDLPLRIPQVEDGPAVPAAEDLGHGRVLNLERGPALGAANRLRLNAGALADQLAALQEARTWGGSRAHLLTSPDLHRSSALAHGGASLPGREDTGRGDPTRRVPGRVELGALRAAESATVSGHALA